MSEPPGGEFNQELLKKHTGTDPIQARDLYGGSASYATWLPTHTNVFLTQNPPAVENIGTAIEDRIRVVRLLERYATKEDGRVVRMADTLKVEAEGIFVRLVREARAWYELTEAGEEGLPESTRVTAASAEYIEAHWPLSRFREEYCITDLGQKGTDVRATAKELWDDYQQWVARADDVLDPLTSQAAFCRVLGKKYRKVSDSGSGSSRWSGYIGIKPKSAIELADSGDDGGGDD